jgi:4-nitrophenyl phosphatase
MAAGLERFQGFILDLDGVLWEGETPLPGMAAFLAFLRSHGKAILLATNNASLTPEQYVRKAARMGAEVFPQEVLTSALATADHLRKNVPAGSHVYVLGEDGLVRALSEAGFTIAAEDELGVPVVVVGMDRQLSWKKLANATINIRGGARFIGTNPDSTFPTERGIAHGNGAILAALATATGIQPFIVGKPHAPLFAMALERIGLPKDAVATVGDRLETDILGAQQAGLASILLLTGVTSRTDLEKSGVKPNWVFENLPGLQSALEKSKS